MSRLVSALSLAFALAAQVSTLVHMGVVRHETCAEHGELVEVGALDPRAGIDDHGSPLADDATADEHDHCLLATMPSLHGTPPVMARAVNVSDIDDGVVTPRMRVVAATLLRSAPKTSPPAA